jgi:hypothetical protein
MTERIRAGIFSRRQPIAGLGLAAAILIPLAACSSVPEIASAPPSGLSSGQPTNTGTFPNLNIPPQSATSQIKPEEKAEKFSELEDAKAAQATSPGGSPEADEARLKKIAATHAATALAEIERQ